jgi:hypothetical protein
VKQATHVEEHEQWNFTDDEQDKEGNEQALDDEYATESDEDK